MPFGEFDYRMRRENRLRKGREFRRVFRLGSSMVGRAFVVVVHRRHDPNVVVPRIGVSIKRKIGKAVVRNRIKRLVREAVRAQLPDLRDRLDVVIIARSAATSLSYAEVCGHLQNLFRRGRCFRGSVASKPRISLSTPTPSRQRRRLVVDKNCH